jgi:hypothetical protein
MPWMGLTPEDEIRWVDTLDKAERAAARAAEGVDPAIAARGAHISRVAPWMNAGTLLAVLKGTHSMEPVERIAKQAALDRVARNPTNLMPGDPVHGAQLNMGDRRLFGREREFDYFNRKQEVVDKYEAEKRGAVLGGRGRPPAGMSPLDDLVRTGIVNWQGVLQVPNRHEGDRPGEWEYENAKEAEFGRTFDRFVASLPNQKQGLPAKLNGKFGLYFPHAKMFTTDVSGAVSTPLTSVLGSVATQAPGAIAGGLSDLGLLGEGVTGASPGEQVGAAKDYVTSRRLPGIPGLEGIPRDAGAQIAPVGEYLETHRMPVFPGTEGVTEAQPAGFGGGGESLMRVPQGGFMAINAPLQEAQGVVRNVYGTATGRDVDWWEPQSDLGVMLTTGMSPDAPSSGPDDPAGPAGFFVNPDSEVAKERRRREAEHGGLINGQRVTLGRIAAAGASDLGIIEPGDQAYRVLSGLVDAAATFYLDPTIVATARLTKISEAQKLFKGGEGVEEATGLIQGLFTRNIHGPTAEAWMNGKLGSKVVKRIAEETNLAEINRFTGRRLTRAELVGLTDARTTEEVRTVLASMLGKRFRNTHDVWIEPGVINPSSWAPGSVRDMAQRSMMDVPAPYINPYDDHSVINETEKWLRNAHVLPEATDNFVNLVARAETPDETLDAVVKMMEHSDGVLAASGVPKSIRTQIAKDFHEGVQQQREWFLDEALDHIASGDELAIAGDVVGTGDPFLWVEHASHVIPLPDHRAFRRLSSEYPNWAWTAEGKLKPPARLVQHWQEDIWKPFTLLRGAWPVRVVGEEQLRMAARGWDSIFKDPLSYVAWAVARKEGAIGTPFDEMADFQAARARGNAGWFGDTPGRVRTAKQKVYQKGDAGYVEARAAMLGRMWSDETARHVAQSSTLDEAFDWFATSPQRAEFAGRRPLLNEDEAARAYLEIASKRLSHYTAGNDELLDAVRTGMFRGEQIIDKDTGELSKSMVSALGDDLFHDGPESVVGDVLPAAADRAARSKVTDRLFTYLMAKPTNYLSRSPVFRQAYWRRIEEMISHATPEAKAELLAGARENLAANFGPIHLGKSAIKRMERVEAVGKLTAHEIDAYAKAYGLDEVQFLLYDLSKRSQLADSFKLVAPFAEAWKEVVTRWATLANPASFRGLHNIQRFQQVMHAARGEDLGDVMGAPVGLDGRQSGFFWKDEYGEEVFIMPGSQWLTGQKWAHVPDWVPAVGGMGAPGIPIPLTGRVQGLSMFGTIVPGVGPAAAIPVSWVLQDKPGWQREAREWILPYGSVTDEEGQSAIFNTLNFAPSWMRTGFQAFLGGGFDRETNRIYANAQMSAANYLYSTGRYDTTSTAGQQRLLHDAKKAARNLYLVKSFVAFGAPTAPRADWLVETNDGAVRFAALRDDYYRMLADPKIGPAAADEEFLKRWGEFTGMTMQSFTREIQGGIGVSRAFGDWARENPDLKAALPTTYAFFGPQEGKFDYPTYQGQINRGERETLTLDEWFRLGQHHLGSMQIDKAQASMPDNPSDADRAWYDSWVDWVYENYPGYNDFRGVAQRADSEVIFRELGKAVKDKRVNNTEAGKALVDYWALRQQVLDAAKGQGLKTIKGKAFAEDRAWLFENGQWLVRHYPDFKALWNRYLRSEVDPDAG